MAVGAFGSTAVASLFLMNLPVEGEPVEIVEYFHSKLKYHAMGWIAGVIWGIGTIGVLVANTASRESNLRLPTGFSYFQAVPFLAGLIGLVVVERVCRIASRKGRFVMALVAGRGGRGAAGGRIASPGR